MNSFFFSERGLESAQRLTSAIYSNKVDSLNDLNDSEIKEISFLPSKIKEKILSSPVFNSLKKPFLELRKI